MDPPQHIDHQCGNDPALQESFVVVQSVLDLYHTQKVGAFIAKQHLNKPDIIIHQHWDQALQRRGRVKPGTRFPFPGIRCGLQS